MLCCGKTGYSYVVVKMDSGGSSVWMEEGANPECCEETESRCVVRLTRRLAGRSRKQWFSSKEGIGVAQPVLAPWLGESGDGRH